MDKLIATLDDKEYITVIKKDNKITVYVDDLASDVMKGYLQFKGDNLSIGGTYYPEVDTLLFYYMVLMDLGYKVSLIGKLEEIPYEDDLIY